MVYNIIILTHIVRFLGGYHMITAKEARTKVFALETKSVREEKRRVEEIITKEVDEGQLFCWLDFCISDATEQWLQSLGYKVDCKSILKKTTLIRW